MLACYHGRQRGAAPDLANDRGQTPLAGAAFKGDLAVAGTLLDYGAAIVACNDRDGAHPPGLRRHVRRAKMVVYLRAPDPAGGPPESG